ncbi:ArsR family transcriptional regulator [Curtobacterium sp. L3-7]|uniref:ArsR/SmtB family transcription factor n=1 Tax=Curtobacterium sp. L3-7 TaxID=3138787 RepID=UPI003B52BE02
MVVRDEMDAEAVDRVFAALADATRRDIVRRVIVREQSVSSLASGYAMSFAAVQKHVAVLERAELVRKERRGREQIVTSEIGGVRRADRLLRSYEDLWRHRVDRITELLADEGPADRPHTAP